MTRTPLSERMHTLADSGHARAAELRNKADLLDAAAKGFYADPQTHDTPQLVGAVARARRLWRDVTGEPLV